MSFGINIIIPVNENPIEEARTQAGVGVQRDLLRSEDEEMEKTLKSLSGIRMDIYLPKSRDRLGGPLGDGLDT